MAGVRQPVNTWLPGLWGCCWPSWSQSGGRGVSDSCQPCKVGVAVQPIGIVSRQPEEG
jgi:hypothetical protein